MEMERVSNEVLEIFKRVRALCDQVGQKPYAEMLAQAVTFTEEMKRRFVERASRLQNILQLTAPEILMACQPFDIILRDLKRLQDESVILLASPWRRAKYKDLIREKVGADWFDISPAERHQRAHDNGAEIAKEFDDSKSPMLCSQNGLSRT